MAKPNLAALVKATKGAATAEPETAPSPAAKHDKTTSRDGKVQFAVWLPAEFRASVRAVQVQHPRMNIQDLMAEALNDLFEKYRVPTVRLD